MNKYRSLVSIVPAAALGVLLIGVTQSSHAYIETPQTLGLICRHSTHILVVRVEEVNKDKSWIICRKVRDIKGKHTTDVVKQDLGKGGFHPRERQFPLEWAAPGKTAVLFHNGSVALTCIGTYWYRTDPNGEWWNLTQAEPYLLRAYYGSTERLAAAVTEIVAGREVIVPCLADGNKDDMHQRQGKVQRWRASLNLQDYHPTRDFVGWEEDASSRKETTKK